MKKIFIVEDDENIRELIHYALVSAGFEAVGFENSHEFFKQMKQHDFPHLILLDIMLPDEDGMTILKKIRHNKQTGKLPVIMLTAKSDEYDRIKGLDLGADDYITKPFSILELISRIKAVLRRSDDTTESKTVLTLDNLVLDMNKYQVLVEDQTIFLTRKEFELLHVLLINKGIVLTRDKLMNEIWGFDYEGESRTVDMHVKTLRQKLGTASKLIKTIRGVGYKIGD